MGGYLLLAYGTAGGIWLMCGMMPPGAVTAQLLNTVVMWTPALAVWLMWLAGRRRPVLSFSLRPALRRNWKWYLAAWALSLAAAVLGALLLGELASLGLRKKPLAPGALIGASAVLGIALSLI